MLRASLTSCFPSLSHCHAHALADPGLSGGSRRARGLRAVPVAEAGQGQGARTALTSWDAARTGS